MTKAALHLRNREVHFDGVLLREDSLRHLRRILFRAPFRRIELAVGALGSCEYFMKFVLLSRRIEYHWHRKQVSIRSCEAAHCESTRRDGRETNDVHFKAASTLQLEDAYLHHEFCADTAEYVQFNNAQSGPNPNPANYYVDPSTPPVPETFHPFWDAVMAQ